MNGNFYQNPTFPGLEKNITPPGNISNEQNILMEHLNYAIRGISNKNLIPVLSCIKFDVKLKTF